MSLSEINENLLLELTPDYSSTEVPALRISLEQIRQGLVQNSVRKLSDLSRGNADCQVVQTIENLTKSSVFCTPESIELINEKKTLVDDSYLYLEEMDSPESLAWVAKQNARTEKLLKRDLNFTPIQEKILSICNDNERLPHYRKRGSYYYDYIIDENHPRGIWLRAPIESIDSIENGKPVWETVLDLDELSAKENENWVWKGPIDLNDHHGLIKLSRGGKDAVVVREFNYDSKQFIEDGFVLPEAKTHVYWKDEDTLYVVTDFGDGSMTESGYPRMIKEWTRGTPVSEAKLLFEVDRTDALLPYAFTYTYDDDTFLFCVRRPTFFTNIVYLESNGRWIPFDKPDDAEFNLFKDQILLTLHSDWNVGDRIFSAGSVVAIDGKTYLPGESSYTLLFEPGPRNVCKDLISTKNFLILKTSENLKNKAVLFQYENDNWNQQLLEVPPFGSIDFYVTNGWATDEYELFHSDYLTPGTLQKGDLNNPLAVSTYRLSDKFQSEDLEITLHEAVSKDGTKIPYYQVGRRGIELNGKHPTLLYGYGGFGHSVEPSYLSSTGSAWLEKGGVFVEACIRGGGDFGPDWHFAATKENRQKSFDDFIAVAEDLVRRGITSPEHLGIQGGSNGGLLMGVMLTQRPDLWNAVLCSVPLLDMKRYNKLLAGASWMEEYGNPDIEEEWAYLKKYSPYQNLHEGIKYPRIFFTTSSSDDRVHPGHARKMAAKMMDMGCDVLYFENEDGGHSGAANNEERACKAALQYSFLWQQLKGL